MDLPRLMVSAAQEQGGSLLDQKIKALSFTEKEKDKKKCNYSEPPLFKDEIRVA